MGCSNCSNKDCNGNCDKQSELYYSSQIEYDGQKIEMPNTGITINPCEPLNDVILKLANALEAINTP